MEKVDELIDALAEHIKKRIDEGNDMENEITEKTKAIVPVHYAGVACEMDTIMDISVTISSRIPAQEPIITS